MAKKRESQTGKSVRPEKEKIYVDELYFRHVDQAERWRQEAERCQAIENKLVELSRLTYEEFDYSSQLVRTIFKEKEIPDFSYMVEEARIAAENKFSMPIIKVIVTLIILVAILILVRDTVLLWLSGAGVIGSFIYLFLMIENRHSHIEEVVRAKKEEIERKIEYEKQQIAQAKKIHEDNEDERIKRIECLLDGELSSIFAKIEHVLVNANFPFHLDLDVELYDNIPSVKMWLPSKTIIPSQICTIKPSGRTNYEDKDIRAINRQYAEFSAAIVIRILAIIYSYIPTFDIGYVYVMSKEEKDDCLIMSKLDRQTLIDACTAANGLAGIQKLKATFECDTLLDLLPIKIDPPEEWNGVERQSIHCLHLNL